jgi:hypothetical protein
MDVDVPIVFDESIAFEDGVFPSSSKLGASVSAVAVEIFIFGELFNSDNFNSLVGIRGGVLGGEM